MPRWSAIAVSDVIMLRARRARGWITRLPGQLTSGQVAEVAQWPDRPFPGKAD
jgi:hypothetical protein